MDIEQKQADLIEHFVKQVKSPIGAPVSKAIVDATSHPLLFTFSEILSLPNVAEGIVRGKLNQLRRCFEVQCAAVRDLRPGQLGSMIEILSAWLTTSDNLLLSIQDKIKWADTMGEAYNKHKKEIEDKGAGRAEGRSDEQVRRCSRTMQHGWPDNAAWVVGRLMGGRTSKDGGQTQ